MSVTSRYLYKRNKQTIQQQKYQDQNPLNQIFNDFNKYIGKKNIDLLPPINQYKRNKSHSYQYDSLQYEFSQLKHPYLDNIKPKQKLKTRISQLSELEIRLSLQVKKVTINDIKKMRQNNQTNGSGLTNRKNESLLTLENMSNLFQHQKLRRHKKYIEETQKKTENTEQFICGWLQLINDDN
ncbi:unnamed protein product (macronuclear) [Paramecium tetraurelia]|uniref:Chromosome undetermined scaffold_1, whole genome shotgun sequence n=1 Tax=Paramecium tetraurelia TaxID=5888 RepID=Q6BFY8_PARTE|nr:hypothetical protein [Paramecium tetraurelia strain d4-2]XP_001423246.1 uncharacterized protein GSPATT00000283001 [Paramecium tetraurelia]CAH03432.1 hypothetical protein PTMB.234 [Paramecium tetraurelia]CAK55848.1 unnamed protein product [Paramecium tetraurelia]|eukprot:XP_001423246.1 hypothetical protein (macronuclear) [Paramecium tetraurelia strain d4-2]